MWLTDDASRPRRVGPSPFPWKTAYYSVQVRSLIVVIQASLVFTPRRLRLPTIISAKLGMLSPCNEIRTRFDEGNSSLPDSTGFAHLISVRIADELPIAYRHIILNEGMESTSVRIPSRHSLLTPLFRSPDLPALRQHC